MIDASIQAIFAVVFATIARYCLPRGWMFVRMGWFGIRAIGDAGAVRHNVEHQRGMSSATHFLLAGLVWMAGGLLSSLLMLGLLVMAVLSVLRP
jgi:hypothetical protein